MSLSGRVAFVTGASQGIGRACALKLASAGATVAVAARNQDKLNELVAEITAAGGKAAAFALDVTDEELQHELEHMAGRSGESVEALNARLTKQGALDRMKAKLRSDKTVDWLAQNAQVKTVAASAK